MPKATTRMRTRFAALLAALGLTVAGVVAADQYLTTDPTAPTATAADLFVTPGGRSSVCTAGAPCGTINQAISVARPGQIIELAEGKYPAEVLHRRAWMDTATEPVTIRGRLGADVTLGPNPNPSVRWDVHAGWITWRDIQIRDIPFYAYGGSANSTWERVRFTNVPFYLRGSNTTVRDSLLVGGYDCPDNTVSCGFDGINVSSSFGLAEPIGGILIERNTIRGYTQGSFAGFHADCIQLFDVDGVTIRQNRMSDCYNQALTVSAGNNLGVRGVIVESNFLDGVAVDSHGGANGQPQTEIAFYNNTITGSFRQRQDSSEFLVGNNLIGYASDCVSNDDPGDGPNYIADWNKGLCSSYPAALGNVTGPLPALVSLVDDLHLTGPAPQLAIADPALLPEADIDGAPFCAPYVGADSPPC